MHRKYGIRGKLPSGDPMRAAHLLGDNWEWTRWYPSAAERARAYDELARHFNYYRAGDKPSVTLKKIEE